MSLLLRVLVDFSVFIFPTDHCVSSLMQYKSFAIGIPMLLSFCFEEHTLRLRLYSRPCNILSPRSSEGELTLKVTEPRGSSGKFINVGVPESNRGKNW